MRARGLNASILPVSVLNSASVMSLVRHSAAAGVTRAPSGPSTAGLNGRVHFLGQRRHENIRRRVQIVLRVAAHQLQVLGEGHVALDDAGAHARGGFVGLARVFGELQRRTPVANREVRLLERSLRAARQLCLEPARFHVVDEEERPRTELHALVRAVTRSAVLLLRGAGDSVTLCPGNDSGGDDEREDRRAHGHSSLPPDDSDGQENGNGPVQRRRDGRVSIRQRMPLGNGCQPFPCGFCPCC